MYSTQTQLWRTRLIGLFLAITGAVIAHAADKQSFQDNLDQRLKACTFCHGDQGRAAPDGYYPRIAGKPAGYLYNQLKHFQRGERWYTLMTQMVEPLSNEYLWEIAQHFSGLDLPYPPPLPVTASPEALSRGERLVLKGDLTRQLPACVACHGSHLIGALPATPGLLGLPSDYINAQIGAWQTGSRHSSQPDCMAKIANQLTPDDIAAISAWLSSQPWPKHTSNPIRTISDPPMECGSHATPKGQP